LGTYTYDPWGKIASHTGTATSSLGYDGQYTDAESGYVYLRARSYDPATGQFLSLDPAVALTRVPYGYAADDPLNRTDPLGLINWWHVAKAVGTGLDALAVGACVAAAATTAEIASPACAALAYAGGVVGGGTALHECLTGDKSCKGDVVCAVGGKAVPGKPAQTSLTLLCDLAPNDTSPAQRNPYCPNGYIDPNTGTYDQRKLQEGPLNLKQNGLRR
jgi:RHS repeat-associated protein